MTARKKKQPEDTKAKLLAAALKHVPFDGFSDRAIERAAEDVGVEKAAVAELFPDGAQSLVEAFSRGGDAELDARLAKLDLKSLKIRERIATAVLTRIDILRPDKEAARRAGAFLSLPPNLGLATKLLYATVDTMWRAAGDTSTDFNFYTKRGILAGVYSATLVRWFNDTSADETPTKEFLAARIENVMQFERFKGEVKDAVSRLPSLSDVLRSFQGQK
jgi:ubiquinone biosynthesis protein COQ9